MVEFSEMVSNQPQFRARAYIDYDENLKSMIVCKEPACNFYNAGGCLNKKAVINDECTADQWCEIYIPRN